MGMQATIKRGLSRGVIFRDFDFNLHFTGQGQNFMSFFQPSSGLSFNIEQDRIFTTHFPRQINIGVNFGRKELKMTLKEPEVSTPVLLLIHSRTNVAIREATITGEVDLSQVCPNCDSNKYFLTKGESAKKSRLNFDNSYQNLGSMLKSEYFDCELEMDKRSTLASTMSAFMPYNKSPQTVNSILLLGLQEIRAFFLYFPRAEQCGLYAQYSQSLQHPVREIDISIMGKTSDKKSNQRFGMKGKNSFLKVKVKALGPEGAGEDREMKLNVKLESEILGRKNALKVQLAYIPNQNVGIKPYMACFSMDNEYSNANPFEREILPFDFHAQLQMAGKADFKYGEGKTCGEAIGSTSFKFVHSTTAEAHQELRQKSFYKTCVEQKTLGEWSLRQGSPFTMECWKTEVDAARARKYSLEMYFERMTTDVKTSMEKIYTIVKAGLVPYWDEYPVALSGDLSDTPKIDLEFVFKDEDSAIDVTIVTEKGESSFLDLPTALPDWTPNLTQLRYDQSVSQLIESGVVSQCVQSSAGVFTLDSVSYPSTSSTCWSLLSGHCSTRPTYAVFTKPDTRLPLAMKVYIGGHLIEFTPTSSTTIRITKDGEELTVADFGGKKVKEGKTTLFHIMRWGSTYMIYSDYNVMISYDGTFVQVIPAPWVKGQHCGVCGNYDGNKNNDLLNKVGDPIPGGEMSAAWCQ